MKKIIYKLTSFLLCAALTVSLFGCDNSANNPTEPTEPPLQLVEPTLKDGVYQITEAGHMLFLQQNPNKNYALCNDIDMGGYVWTPVAEFTDPNFHLFFSFLYSTVTCSDSFLHFYHYVLQKCCGGVFLNCKNARKPLLSKGFRAFVSHSFFIFLPRKQYRTNQGILPLCGRMVCPACGARRLPWRERLRHPSTAAQ